MNLQTRTEPAGRLAWSRYLQIARRVLADVERGELSLHAAGLVYATLVSLVPLLAFSFSILKGLGVHNDVEPLLLAYLRPLGPEGAELGQRIIGFIDRVQVGVLGSVGLVLLVFTAVSLVHRVELAFNRIWQVERPRPMARRISDYVSTLVVGPVLVFSAMAMTAAVVHSQWYLDLTSLPGVGPLLRLAAWLLPYLMVMIAFAFVYLFIPHTRVRPAAAAAGAVVAGILWETLGWGFNNFVAGATNYAAIYSSFAILVLFLIWLYLSWLVLLLGAQISYLWQHQQRLRQIDLRVPGPLPARHLALKLLCRLSQAFEGGEGPLAPAALSTSLGVPQADVEHLAGRLCEFGWLVRTDRPSRGLMLACPAAGIALSAVLSRLDLAGDDPRLSPALVEVEAEWLAALEDRFQGRTLADLCRPEGGG